MINVPAGTTDTDKLMAQANQSVLQVVKSGNDYTLSVTGTATYTDPTTSDPVAAATDEGLFKFTSADQAARGDQEWVAILIPTDEVLTNVTLDGNALTQSDIDAAQSVGATDNKTMEFFYISQKIKEIKGYESSKEFCWRF